jgi:glycosyltransferase 2 family protein
MEQRRRDGSLGRVAVLLIQGALVVVLCWAVFRTVDFARLIGALRQANFLLFALAVIPLVAERIVRPYRLFALFGGRIPFRDVVAAQSVSQLVNLVLPMRSGEVSLLVMLRALGHASFSYAMSIVLIDRLLDVAIVLLIFAWAIVAVPDLPSAADKGAAVLAIACVGVVAAMLIISRFKQRVLSIVQRLLIRAAGGERAGGWLGRIEAIVDGFAVLSDPRKLGIALLATVVTWGLASFASWLMLAAIWSNPPFAAVCLAICLATIGSTLISVPAGIGVVHAASMLAIMMFGASQEIGLAFAVSAHAIVTGVTAIMGLVYFPIARRLGLRMWGQGPAKS